MILRDHSTEKIIQAMEDNIGAFALLIPPKNPHFEKVEFDGMVRVTTGLQHPIAN
ncbi:MAG: hypothetical protein ACXAB4_03440 [Candidatus Hodarchaeales archaeon]